MTTSLHHSPIYGPVHSRRLGLSLGINLMPGDGKICNFDCVYCECGTNSQRYTVSPRPTRQEVSAALEQALGTMLAEGKVPDVLTFAGNGEPTAHPDFAAIVDDTISMRNRYCPNARISVLSNATLIGRHDIFSALMKVDDNILKLDTADTYYIYKVNRPQQHGLDIGNTIELMRKFNGHVIIQTIFMKGDVEGDDVDNTSEQFVAPWLDAIRSIAPSKVMIYTIDRDTPVKTLRKADKATLDGISARVVAAGFECSVAY